MATQTESEDDQVYDIFISYASVNREIVERLVQRLKRDGFRIWFDVDQIQRGQTTLGQLADGIANSSHMIACLSDAYIEREFTRFELETNQSSDPVNDRNRTIPVKIEQLSKPIPNQIRFINIGDLTDHAKYDAEYQRITRSIRRDQPKSKPTGLDWEALKRKCEAPFKDPNAEPSVALFQVRIAAESLCRFLYRQALGEPPTNATLDLLVQALLSTQKLPPHIKISLGTVQAYGNFVVKDQVEDYVITQESIQPSLAALKVITDWTFTTYFGQPQEQDFWESVWTQLPYLENPGEREIPGTKYVLRAPRLSLNSLGPLYAGQDKVWHQAIAINLVALSDDNEATFFEEVSQFIRLKDASVVRPLDAGKVVVNGKRLCLYVILEQVDGASAQDLMERFGKLPPHAACEICRGVAISLEGFHNADPPIVHGDIKPANVVVDRYGAIKVLCIGRNSALRVDDASAGATDGKIDSFLFASPEQLAGATNLTPKTDIFALRAMLFYLLTGEYEARVPDQKLAANSPIAVREALVMLAACDTAKQARDILDSACQHLATHSSNAHTVIDCYREGRSLPTASLPSIGVKPPPPAPQKEFALLSEFPVESRNAWPLTRGRILVWESGADTLAVLEGSLEDSQRLWRDSHSMRVRCVARGPTDEVAIASWEGLVRCFAGGALSAALALDGAIGDVKFCAGRWIAGTWKQSLVSIATTDDVIRLLDVREGIFRIAVADDTDRFAVADLSGGISIYSAGKRMVNTASLGIISSMAYAGHRLLILLGQSLIAVELDGRAKTPEHLSGISNARLLPSPIQGRCLLLAEDGSSWLIDATGTHLPYFRIPDGHTLMSDCRIQKRFILGLRGGGCGYWRDGQQQQVWPDAICANLSSDGRLIAVTFPGKVQLYEDSR